MRAREFIFENFADGKGLKIAKEGKMRPTHVTGTEKPGSVGALEKALLKAKDRGIKLNYDKIDKMMQLICKEYNLTGDKLHNDFVKKHHTIPDNWIKKQSVTENFADGKGPGRPGDSQRHGIPKKATMTQLKKASKAKGRKGQLARWQINMRRGKKKHAKESIQETIGPHEREELELMLHSTKPAALINYNQLYEKSWQDAIQKNNWTVEDIDMSKIPPPRGVPWASTKPIIIVSKDPQISKNIKRLMLVTLGSPDPAPESYHIQLGRLLGYSEDDIEDFLRHTGYRK
jgi:hypothetical protein